MPYMGMPYISGGMSKLPSPPCAASNAWYCSNDCCCWASSGMGKAPFRCVGEMATRPAGAVVAADGCFAAAAAGTREGAEEATADEEEEEGGEAEEEDDEGTTEGATDEEGAEETEGEGETEEEIDADDVDD